MTGKFHLKKANDGQFHFSLLASSGEMLLTSELYKSKESAENGIRSVKANSRRDGAFELRTASNGRYYFILKATNGQVIGQSQMYATRHSAELGIIAVKKHASDSLERDFSRTEFSKAIGSVRTFLSSIERIEQNRDSVIFYRGHGDVGYSLTPSIYRNSGWLRNEHIIFHELVLRCPSDFEISGPTFSTLVKMQHYSLPTRLLDITANPLIALYFACSSGGTADAEVLVFNIPKTEIKYYDSDTVSVISNIGRMPDNFSAPRTGKIQSFNMNEDIIRLVREIQREKPYFEPRIKPTDLNSVVCVKPVLDNPRIIKQDGAFLLFGMSNEKSKPAIVPDKYLISKGDFKIVIHGADKPKILEQLERLGVTRSTIYPEIEHVASYIRDAYKE